MSLSPRPKSDLAASTVWAIVVVILGFLAFTAFLVNGGKTAELRSIMVLVGQAFIALVNIFIVYRSSLSTNRRVEKATEIAEEVKQAVNGNTPQPGSMPPVGYVPEH